jgi:hypothetical protein
MRGSRRQKVLTLLSKLGARLSAPDFEEKFIPVKIITMPWQVKETMVQYLEPIYRIEFDNINAN